MFCIDTVYPFYAASYVLEEACLAAFVGWLDEWSLTCWYCRCSLAPGIESQQCSVSLCWGSSIVFTFLFLLTRHLVAQGLVVGTSMQKTATSPGVLFINQKVLPLRSRQPLGIHMTLSSQEQLLFSLWYKIIYLFVCLFFSALTLFSVEKLCVTAWSGCVGKMEHMIIPFTLESQSDPS